MCDIKIRRLLSDESKWTKGANARDEHNMAVHVDAPYAKCFCLNGAIIRCYGRAEEADSVMRKIRQHLLDSRGYPHGVVFWNDSSDTKFSDIRTVLETLDV